jgi:aldose sugar dehydrogenase
LSFQISFLSPLILLGLILASNFSIVYGQAKYSDLQVETILSEMEAPVGMAFLGPDDMLVIEKNTGKVQRVVNGNISEEPLLDLDVANQVERGLLGVAVSENSTVSKTYVFLYFTEAERGTGVGEGEDEDNGEGQVSNGDGGQPIGNRLYRYELSEDGNKLVNPSLLLDLPYQPGPAHNGGTVAVGGPNNNVCVVIGNLEVRPLNEGTGNNLAQNVLGGEKPDGRAGIICVTQDGQRIIQDSLEDHGIGAGGILGDEHPLDMYYAYGIRNSFGLAFDPVTGKLWDTENGGFDEINLVEPGFNSGFSVITGSSLNDDNNGRFSEDDLVDFNGNGKYSDPELDIGQHMIPTAITFVNSDSLGEEYENDMFVASYPGRIFHFDLDDSRTQLALEGDLADKIADTEEELEGVTFAEDIGPITDLKVGPDGYLYAVIFSGDIVRITPGKADTNTDEQINSRIE